METIEGMRYLHGEGVIHKDLKPENILVDDDFHIKVNLSQGSCRPGAALPFAPRRGLGLGRRPRKEEPAQLVPGGSGARQPCQGVERQIQPWWSLQLLFIHSHSSPFFYFYLKNFFNGLASSTWRFPNSRGRMGAAAAGLHQSHSHARSSTH